MLWAILEYNEQCISLCCYYWHYCGEESKSWLKNNVRFFRLDHKQLERCSQTGLKGKLPPHTWLDAQTLFHFLKGLQLMMQGWSCSYPTPNPEASFLLCLAEVFLKHLCLRSSCWGRMGNPWRYFLISTQCFFTPSPPLTFSQHESIKLPERFVQGPLNPETTSQVWDVLPPFSFSHSVQGNGRGDWW